ncbi:MAG: hypothetical protein HW403_913 [Dehalococcoidia bacterium]|nr:hypothetical protein [Dehalococcoidia bacterium]
MVTKTTLKRGKGIFYGWWIVLASVGIIWYGAGTFFYGFSIFFDPMLKEFGWSRATLSLGASLQRLEGGLAAPIVGILTDKYGPRKLMLFGVAVGGIGFFLLSRVNSPISFYIAMIVISLGLSSAMGVVSMAAVANWFVRKRGLALGIMTAGAAMGGTLAPVMVWLISRYGWRGTFIISGIGLWVVGIPLAAVVRHRPEQYGMLPDGDETPPDKQVPAAKGVEEDPPTAQRNAVPEEEAPQETEFTAWEAARTPAFWLIPIAVGLSEVKSAAIVVHIVSYLTGIGISRNLAALTLSAFTISSLLGRVGLGYLGDMLDKRKALAFSFLLQLVGLLILSYVNSPWMLIPFVLTYGPGYGGPIPLWRALQGDYFGRKSFGSIQGWMQSLRTAFQVGGPFFAGWVFDVTGSYRPAFLFFAVTVIIAIPVILFVKPPTHPSTSASRSQITDRAAANEDHDS